MIIREPLLGQKEESPDREAEWTVGAKSWVSDPDRGGDGWDGQEGGGDKGGGEEGKEVRHLVAAFRVLPRTEAAGKEIVHRAVASVPRLGYY